MATGFLIESLLGAPMVSTTTSSNTSGGARKWIKNKLKDLSQLLGKLARRLFLKRTGKYAL